MRKISIVTAYYNRKPQFLRTLKSIEQSANAQHVELIVVDDCSNEEHDLSDVKTDLDFKLIKLKKENKWYTNPCIPFNIGFKEATGDAIILQNPECYHVGDIISDVIININDNDYLSYGCYALSEGRTQMLQKIRYNNYKEQISKFFGELPQRGFSGLGENGWYNHSQFRPVGYHFCSAITRNNLEDLGGFDERYAKGVSYDDDELLVRIKRKGLKIKFIDDPFVLHQCHYSEGNAYVHHLVEKNKALFNKTLQESSYKVNLKNV
jgi:GT2 family glycosyltransferase